MKKILPCILMVFLFMYHGMAETLYWEDVPMQKTAPGPLLDEQKNNLALFEYLNRDMSSAEYNNRYAVIRDDKVIAYFGGRAVPSLINVYDLDGNYLQGYRLFFRASNGVENIHLIQGRVCIYMSAKNCCYVLSSEGVEYYTVDSVYTHDIFTSPSKTTPYPRVVRFSKGLLEIERAENDKVVIVDYQEEYQKRWDRAESSLHSSILFAAIGGLIMLSAVVVISKMS